VRLELARATRIRPAPLASVVVVVEYDSACHLEDLVAERWRGLRPGTVVLVANYGAADGMVAITARAAVPEALERLRGYTRRRGLDAARSRQLVGPARPPRRGGDAGSPGSARATAPSS